MDAEALKHKAPSPTRSAGATALDPKENTRYLPVADQGAVDDPFDGGSKSVYAWDRQIHSLNEKSLNFAPERLYSYCDSECGGGCLETPTTVTPLIEDSDPVVAAPFLGIVEALEAVGGNLQEHEGELWADRVGDVYGNGGKFDIAAIAEQTDAVHGALTDMLAASEKSANTSLDAIRATVRQLRDKLAERYDAAHLHVTDALLLPLRFNPLTLAVSAPFAIKRFYDYLKAENFAPDLSGQQQQIAEAIASHKAAVEALTAALERWTATPNSGAINSLQADKRLATEHPERDHTDSPRTPPEQAVSPIGQPATVASKTEPVTTKEKLNDWLDDLLSKKNDQQPQQQPMTAPASGGMPSSGAGMPSMPQMPTMPNLGDLMQPPTDEPLAADDDLMDAPADDLDDDEDSDTAPDESTDGSVTADEAEFNDQDKDDLNADDPAQQTDQPVDDQATAPAADTDANKTVYMPNGRAATFDDPAMADTVRKMLDADPNNPKSLYMAASEAGYQLPPQGQDVGEKVPPALMKEGDVVAANGQAGVYVGNGDVLMEDQSVKPLSEVSTFDGEHEGIFRLANATTDTDTNGAPMQTVGQPTAETSE